jgi:hypothetical protein
MMMDLQSNRLNVREDGQRDQSRKSGISSREPSIILFLNPRFVNLGLNLSILLLFQLTESNMAMRAQKCKITLAVLTARSRLSIPGFYDSIFYTSNAILCSAMQELTNQIYVQ